MKDRRLERLEGPAFARRLVDVLVDRQASDVALLDLSALSAFTDYFVIATADNDRQLRALIESVDRAAHEPERDGRARVEGQPSDGWVLIDLDEVVVHLFSEEARAYYDLEGLWTRAQQLVRIQ